MLYCITFYAFILLSCMIFLVSNNIRKHKKAQKFDEIKDDEDWTFGAIVPFSCNEIMNILTDFHHYADYVPDIIESTVYEQNTQTCKVRFLTQVLFLPITSHIEHTLKNNEVTWRLDPAFQDLIFQENYGSWIVTQISERESRIKYNVVIKGNLPFPPKMINMIEKEAYRRATGWVVQALKNQKKTSANCQKSIPWYMNIPCFSVFMKNKDTLEENDDIMS